MTPRYVFDTGALIGAERGDKRPLDLGDLERFWRVFPGVRLLSVSPGRR